MSGMADTLVRTGFMVLHGNRLEDLRELLVHTLRAQPLPPLVPEVMLVQSNGMRHWLELALADDQTGQGICAATRMELPQAFVWQAARAVLGAQAVPAQMPLDKDALAWRLVRLLPGLAHDPVYAPLAGYLQRDVDGRRRYQLAFQLADVLDAYQSYRADWLADWARGVDHLRQPGAHQPPLPVEDAWQAALWRAVLADVAQTEPAAQGAQSRAEVHARLVAALQAWPAGAPRPAGLPPRVVVFGISSLPLQTVEALAALGRVCQVLLLVHNPCQYHWGHVVEGRALLRQATRRRHALKPGSRLAFDPQDQHAQGHPLLASWGAQGRDYLHLLDQFDQWDAYRDHFSRVDLFVDPLAVADEGVAPSARLLAQLQSDILNLNPLPAQPRSRSDEQAALDDSVVCKVAHSAQREVEVLLDQLLAWFNAPVAEGGTALSPREVIVMVPDMAGFAPHIQAVFGRFPVGDPRHIPYAVADSSSRQLPLVQALALLLQLPQSRVTLADWLGLFEVAAVRQRFGLDEAAVAQLWDWLQEAGVRWGLNAEHRLAWGLSPEVPGLDQNTWAFGLRRLLLGYASGGAGAGVAPQPWGQTVPLGSVGGLNAQWLGPLADWVQAMNDSLQGLSQAHSPAAWVQALSDLLARFFEPTDATDQRLLQTLRESLNSWADTCARVGLQDALPLDVVREHWLAQVDGAGQHPRFLGGGVQFATLMPMRAIPFRVVCLLGMNDGAYPRPQSPRDFDLMARPGQHRAGDRSRREDDRYLFLEALLSARERFYLSWQGHRATDNAEQPPSVLVSQLLDHLARGWQHPPQPVLQPLQAFSARYFQAGSGYTTYADDWQQVLSLEPEPTSAPPVSAPVPDAPPTPGLLDLRRLLRHPPEVYLRQRLRLKLDLPEEAVPEDEVFDLDALDDHLLGQDLLTHPDLPTALAQLAWTGRLPMAGLGQRAAAELGRKVTLIQAHAAPWLQAWPEALPPWRLSAPEHPCDALLEGWRGAQPADAAGRWPCEALCLAWRTGAVTEAPPRQPLQARVSALVACWPAHLAACAAGVLATTVLIGLDGQVVLPPMPPAQAQAELQALVAVWTEALAQPLPLACQTAWAWLTADVARSQAAPDEPVPEPLQAARQRFEGQGQRQGEHRSSAYLARAFEGFEDLAPHLAPWAPRLYGPLLAWAQVSRHDAKGPP